MRRIWYGVALALGLTLALAGVSLAQGGMMGQGQKGQSGQAAEPPKGGAGMMAPQMMGEGMGGRPPTAPERAGKPQDLTQQETQGAVTVSATLLTPDKPREDGKLAVQVTLDTHSVDLDQYQLEKAAVLRDAEGREIQALDLESASGSGHHREGVLTFPGTDPNGKPVLSPGAKTLTLILRDIGGLPEWVFRWQLSLG